MAASFLGRGIMTVMGVLLCTSLAVGASLDGSTESGTWIWRADSVEICDEEGRGVDTLTEMVTTTKGFIVAVGSTNSSCLQESDNRQLIAIAYDAEGNLQWRHQYQTPAGADLTPRGVAAAEGGGVLICGAVSGGAYTKNGLSYGGLDIFAVTLDVAGTIVASWQFGTAEDDLCFGIVGSPTTGEVYLVAHTHGDLLSGHVDGQTDVLIGVTDSYYEFIEWVLVSNSTIEKVPSGIAAFESGDVAIAGYAVNITEDQDGASTVAMFAQRWNKTGAPPNSGDVAFLTKAWAGSLSPTQTGQNKVVGVVVDDEGNMLVAGQADGQPWGVAPKGYADYVLLKLDGDNGERLCAWQGGTGGGDWPTSIALDIDGLTSYIAGFTDAAVETDGTGKYRTMVVRMNSDCETDATDWWFGDTKTTENQFTTGATVGPDGELMVCRYVTSSGLDESYEQLGAVQPSGGVSTMQLGQIAYADTYNTEGHQNGIGRLGLELTIGFVCAGGAAVIVGVFWAVWWVRKRRRMPLLTHKTSNGSEQGVAADLYFKKPATEFTLAAPLHTASVADGGDGGIELNGDGNATTMEEIDVMSEFAIDITGLLLQSKLGEGFFGTVYRGRWQGQKVAVKKLKQTVDLRSLRHEVSCLGRLRHPNVCFFYGCTKPPVCLIVSELLWGSLYKLLHKDTKQELSDRARFRIVKDIARGLAYIHIRSFVHRDISTSNILLTGDATHIEEICARSTDEPLAKISDFGLSRPSDSAATQVAGNFFYLPPEVYRGNDSTDKSDVYSYALVMWETYTRKKPFSDLSPQLAAFNAAEKLSRPPIDDTIPTGIAFLMQDCWHPEQKERPASAEALEALEEMESQWLGYGGVAAAFSAANEEATPTRMVSETFSPLRAYGKNRYTAMYGGFDDDDDANSAAGGPAGAAAADGGGADAGAGFGGHEDSGAGSHVGRMRNGSNHSSTGAAYAHADRPRQSMTRLGDIAFRLPPEVVRGRGSFTAWYTDMERTVSRSVISGSDAAAAASIGGHGGHSAGNDGDADASGSQAGGYVPFPRHI